MKIYQVRNKTRGVASVWHRFRHPSWSVKDAGAQKREVCGSSLFSLRNLKQRSGDSRDRNTVLATESEQLPQRDHTQSPPPKSGCPGLQERRLRTTAGTWARPQCCTSSALLAAPGLARCPGLRGEVPPSPLLCTSPRESVVGDAHPSASHLQPGARRRGRITGWAGGLGTTRSGGHAGVGAAQQPTAAAR